MDEAYLPLSLLNQLVYCPRRFWLIHVHSEMAVNAFVQEGLYRHQHAHTAGSRTDEYGRSVRSVYVWSDALRITGIADFVEERGGILIPLEHKRGRMGRWLNDHVQLCAQAICLEERTGNRIDYGEIFYWETRRRERVPLDDALRTTTRDTIHQAFRLLALGKMPPPIDHPPKCRDCSLKDICLPQQTLRLLAEEG